MQLILSFPNFLLTVYQITTKPETWIYYSKKKELI